MRFHARVSGQVQGIGYRYFVVSLAKKLSLTGWVRNCSNGDVECEAQGEAKSLQNFLSELKQGHSWARVNEIKQEEIPEKPEERAFEIRF